MLGMLVMLLLWGGLIVLSVWLVSLLFPRNSRGTKPPANNDLSPRQILDSRYARGELTRDQYELMKQDLT
jgi:uncharacterized membrane protein